MLIQGMMVVGGENMFGDRAMPPVPDDALDKEKRSWRPAPPDCTTYWTGWERWGAAGREVI